MEWGETLDVGRDPVTETRLVTLRMERKQLVHNSNSQRYTLKIILSIFYTQLGVGCTFRVNLFCNSTLPSSTMGGKSGACMRTRTWDSQMTIHH